MTGHHEHAVGPSVIGLVVMAAVMAVMMVPFLLEPLTIVRERSLRTLRVAAAAEFSASFITAWFAIALCLLAVAVPATRLGNPYLVLGLGCVLLAIWQLSDAGARVASRCRRIDVPPPSGWRCHLGTLRGGAQEAAACMRTSGGSMILMALAPSVTLMVLVWAVHLWEWRSGRNPFVQARAAGTAIAYGALAAFIFSAALFV